MRSPIAIIERFPPVADFFSLAKRPAAPPCIRQWRIQLHQSSTFRSRSLMKNESRLVVGVDIGGTKVASGLVEANGKILVRDRPRRVSGGTQSTCRAARYTST